MRPYARATRNHKPVSGVKATMEAFSESVPIYVTRKTADGEIAAYSISLWMSLLVILLVWLNVVIWAGIGLWQAGALIF